MRNVPPGIQTIPGLGVLLRGSSVFGAAKAIAIENSILPFVRTKTDLGEF
jgi:hypothetical protein